jgi:transmembrane sensor
MNKHTPPLLSGRIVEEATNWFVEFNEGEVCQPDREAFIEWLKASPEHIRAYLQVTAHWEEAGALPDAAVPSITDLVALAREPTNGKVIPIGGLQAGGGNAKFAASVERSSDESIDSSPRVHRSPAGAHRSPRQFLLAAGVAIAMIGAGGLYWLDQERGIYTTDIGVQRSIQLGDGSTVELNARSKIRVTLRAHERDVELIEGQALFRVAKDHSRPFIVHSGDTNVLAVGTQFDVNKHRSSTTVTVVEGRVAVFPGTLPTGAGPELTTRAQGETLSRKALPLPHAAAAKTKEAYTTKDEVFLAAGEQLTVSNASEQIASNVDVTAATAWTQKQIVFNSTPLSDVVDEFNRYNTRQLVIADPTIANMKISGEFSSTNPNSLLKGLNALGQFKVRETPSRIEISAR